MVLATCNDLASSVTDNPYPDLISRVVVPVFNASSASRRALLVSDSVVAARVADIVVRIPPAL